MPEYVFHCKFCKVQLGIDFSISVNASMSDGPGEPPVCPNPHHGTMARDYKAEGAATSIPDHMRSINPATGKVN
jgi:hypothetical protein